MTQNEHAYSDQFVDRAKTRIEQTQALIRSSLEFIKSAHRRLQATRQQTTRYGRKVVFSSELLHREGLGDVAAQRDNDLYIC